jgi:hypothetical protein
MHLPGVPGFEPPYVVVVVELEDQSGLLTVGNVLDCAHDDVNGIMGEQIGRLVDQRASALDNPLAVMRTQLTMDEYLGRALGGRAPVSPRRRHAGRRGGRGRDERRAGRRSALVSGSGLERRHHARCARPDWVFQADYTQLFPSRTRRRVLGAGGGSPTVSAAVLHV